MPAGLYHALSVYRRKVFIDRLGWDLPSEDDCEQDQFDRDDTVYLVAQDDVGEVIDPLYLRSTHMASAYHATKEQEFELRYQSLFHEGRGYVFPCDAVGHVDLDSFSDRKRESYFYVRALVGREFSMPGVRANGAD
jgi:hypothetical protein